MRNIIGRQKRQGWECWNLEDARGLGREIERGKKRVEKQRKQERKKERESKREKTMQAAMNKVIYALLGLAVSILIRL